MAERLASVFVIKERFLKNSRRVWTFHPSTLISVEGDAEKMNIAYSALQSITPGRVPSQFSIKTANFTDTYYADPHRPRVLTLLYLFSQWSSHLHDLNPLSVRVVQTKWRTGERVECILTVSLVSIDKSHSFTNASECYSSRYLVDLARISITGVDSFALHYSDGSTQLFQLDGQGASASAGASCRDVVAAISTILTRFYSITLPVIESVAVDDIARAPEPLAAAERLFGLPVRKLRHRSSSMVDVQLCFSATTLYLCDASTIISQHALASIRSISTFADDPTKFAIEYEASTKHAPTTLYCTEAESVIASIEMGVRIVNEQRSVLCLGGITPPFYKRPSLWDAPVEDIEEFFMNRVLRLTGKEADTALALYEFNWHLPQLHFSKDKRQVQWVIDIARYHNSMLEKAASPAAGLASASVIVEALHCLQRLFGYRLNYLEVPRLPNLLRLLTDTVRSEHTRVAVAAIMTVLQIIEQPPELKKFEQQNKLVIVQDELVTALLSILAANAKQRTNSLLVYHVLKVFVSIMQTHAATTDKDWYARLLPKLSRPVTVSSLFHLCRSACPAVALNASVMLKVLLQTNTDEIITQIQEAARLQLALLYQISQACDSSFARQRMVSIRLVGLLCEGNAASMELIGRLFPHRLLAYLGESDPEVPAKPVQKKPWLRGRDEANIRQLKQNWKLLFKMIARNHEEPQLLWNDTTRHELTSAIRDELSGFERDSLINREMNKVWNYEEFDVHYPTLEAQLPVGEYYVGLVLRTVPNCTIKMPEQFLGNIFRHLLLETEPAYRIQYLQCMSWCFRTYRNEIGTLRFMQNLVRLLDATITEAAQAAPALPSGASMASSSSSSSSSSASALYNVLENLCCFLLETFKLPTNVCSFIRFNGVTIGLRLFALLAPHPAKVDGVQQHISVCLQVLLTACRCIESTDERGFIKIPLPRAKRDLCSSAHLPVLVQLLACRDAVLVDLAAQLLEMLLSNNSSVVEHLHQQTGVLFFALDAILNATGPIVALAHLLQTIHKQEDGKILARLLPDSLVLYLTNAEPSELASVLCGKTSTPEVIWTPEMQEQLKTALATHLGVFTQRPDVSRYQFAEMPVMKWKGLEDELRCGNYYIRALLDNPTWEVEEPEEVLKDGLSMLNRLPLLKQYLILQAMCILFKKYHRRTPFRTFEGWPELFQVLALDRNTAGSADLALDKAKVLTAASELVLLALWASPQNVQSFHASKGLGVLGTVMHCISRNSSSHAVPILVNVLRVLTKLLTDASTIDEVAQSPLFLRDLLCCFNVQFNLSITKLAIACLNTIADDPRIQERLFKFGVVYYLLEYMLFYEMAPMSVESSGGGGGSASAEPEAQTHCAELACQVLCSISGIAVTEESGHSGNSVTEQKIVAALTHLLSPAMVALLRVADELEFVEALKGTIETPESIWNAQTYSELRAFVAQRLRELRSAHVSANVEEPDVPQLEYQCLANEVRVGPVFLRLYIQHPEWPVVQPREFLQAIVGVLLRQPRVRPVPLATRITLLSIEQFSATHQGHESVLVTPDVLDALCWLLPGGEGASQAAAGGDLEELKPLQDVALNILLLATANKACVDAVCSVARLRSLLRCMDQSANQRHMVLTILEHMLSGSARAVAYLTGSGAAAYLLDLVTAVAGEPMPVGLPAVDRATRALAAQVLRQANTLLQAQSSKSSRAGTTVTSATGPVLIESSNNGGGAESAAGTASELQRIQSAIWPPYVCAMVLRAATEFVTFYDATLRNPDLIWDNANRAAARRAIAALVATARATPLQAPALEYSSLAAISYEQLNQLPQCGNVYYTLVPQYPQHPLHNVRLFLSSAMQRLATLHAPAQVHELLHAVFVTLQQKLEWTHLLGLEPADGIDTLVRLLLAPEMADLAELLTLLLFLAAHADSCRKRLAQNANVLAALAHAIKANTKAIERAVRTTYLLVRSDPSFIAQATPASEIVSVLCSVFYANTNTQVGKYAVACLKIMWADKRYGEPVRTQLKGEESIAQMEIENLRETQWKVPRLDLSKSCLVVLPFNQLLAASNAGASQPMTASQATARPLPSAASGALSPRRSKQDVAAAAAAMQVLSGDSPAPVVNVNVATAAPPRGPSAAQVTRAGSSSAPSSPLPPSTAAAGAGGGGAVGASVSPSAAAFPARPHSRVLPAVPSSQQQQQDSIFDVPPPKRPEQQLPGSLFQIPTSAPGSPMVPPPKPVSRPPELDATPPPRPAMPPPLSASSDAAAISSSKFVAAPPSSMLAVEPTTPKSPSAPTAIASPSTAPVVPDVPAPAPVGGPPPPPPPPPAGGVKKPTNVKAGSGSGGSSAPKKAAPPKPSGSHDDILAQIRQGRALKHVEVKSPEERRAERQRRLEEGLSTPVRGSGGANSTNAAANDVMGALATALAKRRKKMVVDIAANPYGDEDDSGEWD